jgi:hypothetical protein
VLIAIVLQQHFDAVAAVVVAVNLAVLAFVL